MNKLKHKNSFFKYLFIFLDGILLGLVSVGVPGFSSTTVAVIIGVYFLMVEAMANLFTNFKKSIIFILVLYSGYFIGSILAAKTIVEAFEKYPLATTIAIIGLILGSFPDAFIALKGNYKKISGYIVFVLFTSLILLYNFFIAKKSESIIFPQEFDLVFLTKVLVVGLVTSITFVIPGIDYAIVFLSLGIYIPFTECLSSLSEFKHDNYFDYIWPNARILLVFLLGYFIGMVLFSKLVKVIIKKYKPQTSFATVAFILTAPIIVVKNCLHDNQALAEYNHSVKAIIIDYDLSQFIVGILIGVILAVLIFYIGYRHRQNEKRRIKEMLETVSSNVDKYLNEKKDEKKLSSNNETIELNNES